MVTWVPRGCAAGPPMHFHPTMRAASYDVTRNATQRFAKEKKKTQRTQKPSRVCFFPGNGPPQRNVFSPSRLFS